MTTPSWVIETIVNYDTTDRLIKSINKYGGAVEVIKMLPFDMGFVERLPPTTIPYIFNGSIEATKWARNNTNWELFENDEEFNCSQYYSLVNDKSLWNFPYERRPLNELIYHLETGRVKEYPVVENHLFIRPDSPNKEFVGTLLDLDDLDRGLLQIKSYVKDKQLMTYVSAPKTVKREVRCVIGKNNELVTSSNYGKSGKLHTFNSDHEEFPIDELLGSYKSEHCVFICDICQGNSGNWYIMELGPFSSSGLYDLDTDKIVKYINEYYE